MARYWHDGGRCHSVRSESEGDVGALQNYGGEVEVLSLEGGKCTVRYTGPAPIGMGVKAAVKDKFPDIKEVILVD